MAFSSDSPYPVGTLVTDPKLLQNRHVEIELAVDTVTSASAGGRNHALILGDERSGCSSVLHEVARRASGEHQQLAVSLRLGDEPWTRQTLARHLLTAAVEDLVNRADVGSAPWYRSWRNRVYLQDRSPATDHDLLSSALILAVDREGEIDRVVLERDLATLYGLAREAGFNQILLCMDDASPFTEDTQLVEELLSIVDAVGGYSVLLCGRKATAKYFVEATSPCLARFLPVILPPFRGLGQIYKSLSAPLSGSELDWISPEDAVFLRDVLRLTGGNPYEVMLVGHHLWSTCQLGEQEKYALTPRVLDRIIPHLALLAAGGDALRDGAAAINLLPEERVSQAVDLAARSNLTIREIAVARLLKIGSRDTDRVDRGILTADVAAEAERVQTELEALEEAGVIQLHGDGESFSVVGGQPAAVLLKYQARARGGAEAAGQPFELGFMFAVGRALIRDATSRALESMKGSTSLGFSGVGSRDGGGRLSPRPAVRYLGSDESGLERLVQAEVDLIPWGADEYERLAKLLTRDDAAIALAYTAVTHSDEQLEYVELWEVLPGTSHEGIASVWSGVLEEWAPVAAAADVQWIGSEFAVVAGDLAHQALVILRPAVATTAVHSLFQEWRSAGDHGALRRAQGIADKAVTTLRAMNLPDAAVAGELSGLLSRAGFLKSFDDDLLGEAHTALTDATRIGPADGWVTHWNLANVTARRGDPDAAVEHLEAASDALKDWTGTAALLVFVPGREAADCFIDISRAGVKPLVELQRLVFRPGSNSQMTEALDRCRGCGDPAAAEAAAWIEESLAASAA